MKNDWILVKYGEKIVDKILKIIRGMDKYNIYLIISKHKLSKEKINMLKKGKAHLRRNPIQKPKEESKSLVENTGLVGTAGINYKE